MSDFWAYVLHIQKKKANTEREVELDSSYITQKLETIFLNILDLKHMELNFESSNQRLIILTNKVTENLMYLIEP